MKIASVSRDQIEAFLIREWNAVDECHSNTTPRPDWRWQEYCLAAYDGEEIVGAAIFRARGGVAHLSNVISSRDRRSRGIGGALVEEFIQRARGLGCHKLTLRTTNEDKLVRFYRRHGFEVEAILGDDAFHIDRCQMVRFLRHFEPEVGSK